MDGLFFCIFSISNSRQYACTATATTEIRYWFCFMINSNIVFFIRKDLRLEIMRAGNFHEHVVSLESHAYENPIFISALPRLFSHQ